MQTTEQRPIGNGTHSDPTSAPKSGRFVRIALIAAITLALAFSIAAYGLILMQDDSDESSANSTTSTQIDPSPNGFNTASPTPQSNLSTVDPIGEDWIADSDVPCVHSEAELMCIIDMPLMAIVNRHDTAKDKLVQRNGVVKIGLAPGQHTFVADVDDRTIAIRPNLTNPNVAEVKGTFTNQPKFGPSTVSSPVPNANLTCSAHNLSKTIKCGTYPTASMPTLSFTIAEDDNKMIAEAYLEGSMFFKGWVDAAGNTGGTTHNLAA